MRARVLPVLAILLCATTAGADNSGAPGQAALDGVTARGRLLAAYDRAASFATDAVRTEPPDNERVRRYIAVHGKTGWKVLFGKLDPAKRAFLVAYEATAKDSGLKTFDVKTNAAPVAVTGFPLTAAKAMDLALSVFKGEKRPYNIAALPAPNGQAWVYVYPAQTDAKRWPLGGDTRYLVSADGAKIVATRQLHKSILEFASPATGAAPAAGYHTAILDNLPEDTDVAYVLGRRPSIPEYILTPKFGYLIQPNGGIVPLGARAEAEKKMRAQ